MKFFNRHISLIFPLVAILLGLEFFLVFNRITINYEKKLKDDYSILIVGKNDLYLRELQSWDNHIVQMKEIDKDVIIDKINQFRDIVYNKKIYETLPTFYSIKLNSLLTIDQLIVLKSNLLKNKDILKVETFNLLYESNYSLFSFIKISFGAFILFMTIIGIFLIFKQMEVWYLRHSEQIKIMKILGASILFRIRNLIRLSFIDALISVLLSSIIFKYIQQHWINNYSISIFKDNIDLLFLYKDIFYLSICSFSIVIISILFVVFSLKNQE